MNTTDSFSNEGITTMTPAPRRRTGRTIGIIAATALVAGAAGAFMAVTLAPEKTPDVCIAALDSSEKVAAHLFTGLESSATMLESAGRYDLSNAATYMAEMVSLTETRDNEVEAYKVLAADCRVMN